jgi:hypothetical protein
MTRENLGEQGAFTQLVESLRQAEEAATQLGMHQSQGAWSKVAILMQQVRMQVTDLATGGIPTSEPLLG